MGGILKLFADPLYWMGVVGFVGALMACMLANEQWANYKFLEQVVADKEQRTLLKACLIVLGGLLWPVVAAVIIAAFVTIVMIGGPIFLGVGAYRHFKSKLKPIPVASSNNEQ